MSAGEAAAERAGAVAAACAADRLVVAIGAAVPGVRVTRIDGGVAIGGRGLARRLFDDALLRWPGSLR